MLMPKRVKRRRVHRGRMTGKALRGNTVTYGDWATGLRGPRQDGIIAKIFGMEAF